MPFSTKAIYFIWKQNNIWQITQVLQWMLLIIALWSLSGTEKLCTPQSMPICNKLISIKIEQIPNFQEGNVLSEIQLKRI